MKRLKIHYCQARGIYTYQSYKVFQTIFENKGIPE